MFIHATLLMYGNTVGERRWYSCSDLRLQSLMAVHGTFIYARMQETYLHMQGGPVPMKAKAIAINASAFGLRPSLYLCLLYSTGGDGLVPGNGLRLCDEAAAMSASLGERRQILHLPQ